MSNKVYIGFIVLFALAVGAFLYVRKENGGFSEVKISRKAETKHEIRGFYLEGSFKNEKDSKEYDRTERLLIETYGLRRVSAFYYVNPSEDNREAYKVFIGEEISEASGVLPDSLETRAFSLKNVILGEQESNPTFNTVSDKIIKHLEQICEDNSDNCLSVKQDSIYEQYSRNSFKMEMQLK